MFPRGCTPTYVTSAHFKIGRYNDEFELLFHVSFLKKNYSTTIYLNVINHEMFIYNINLVEPYLTLKYDMNTNVHDEK